jgi:hypothetical protein
MKKDYSKTKRSTLRTLEFQDPFEQAAAKLQYAQARVAPEERGDQRIN